MATLHYCYGWPGAGKGAACRRHVLDVPPAVCRQRIRERNQARPPGPFYGEVDDALIDAVVAHIVPPTP